MGRNAVIAGVAAACLLCVGSLVAVPAWLFLGTRSGSASSGLYSKIVYIPSGSSLRVDATVTSGALYLQLSPFLNRSVMTATIAAPASRSESFTVPEGGFYKFHVIPAKRHVEYRVHWNVVRAGENAANYLGPHLSIRWSVARLMATLEEPRARRFEEHTFQPGMRLPLGSAVGSANFRSSAASQTLPGTLM